MQQYEVKRHVTGAINGRPWPKVGEVLTLPEGTGDGMVEAGLLEPVKGGSTTSGTSTGRRGRRARTRKDRAEKRPAATDAVETRDDSADSAEAGAEATGDDDGSENADTEKG